MIIYEYLESLKLLIILNPFEWSVCFGLICFFTGSYFEYLTGWFKPYKYEIMDTGEYLTEIEYKDYK